MMRAGTAHDDYHLREDLMTVEELEDFNAEPSSKIIDRTLGMHILMKCPAAAGDAAARAAFLARPPALGLTRRAIDGILSRSRACRSASTLRRAAQMLRGSMLTAMVPCSGASTVEELCAALITELESGATLPLPAWYKWASESFGRGRRMGFFACDARGCWKTETAETSFSCCARCKKPMYCSRECQAQDWKQRHKQLCGIAPETDAMTAELSVLLERFKARTG